MGKKSAKTGGSSTQMIHHLQKKSAKAAPAPVESEDESVESGNFVTFNKKGKDSDEEDDQDVFNLALGEDDEDDEDSEVSLLFCWNDLAAFTQFEQGNDENMIHDTSR